MLFKHFVEYSHKVKEVSSKKAKIDIIAQYLGKLEREEAEIGISFISGRIRQGRLNLAWKGLSGLLNVGPNLPVKSPSLKEVDVVLSRAQSVRGRSKVEALRPLFASLSANERKFLVMLILGDIQQGAGEGLVKKALVRFFDAEDSAIEHAHMLIPELGKLFVHLLDKGKVGLKNIGISIFKPVKPMLAQTAESVDDVLKEHGNFALEHKLDGVRIQIHKSGTRVKIFSRHLKEITMHFPELVDVAKTIPVEEFILDGEAIGIDKDGQQLPFQVLAKRTTRKRDINTVKKKIRVIPQFFDVLYTDGHDCMSMSYKERSKILSNMIVKTHFLTQRAIPHNRADAKTFFEDALAKGNEGIMVKLLDSAYKAGKRGKLWFKIKKAHTIDCVILAAEWGHGRRTGWLSNLHLGVLDETNSKYLMVGKTFKGLTDEMMRWLTEHLQNIKVHENTWAIYVKPEIVVEVAFNEVQTSPKYDSRIALRFARVKAIRHDKKPNEINTILDLENLMR
jgi:DNA ligase-1